MNNVLRTFRSHFINTEFVGATPEASVVLIQITLLLGGLINCLRRGFGRPDYPVLLAVIARSRTRLGFISLATSNP